MFTGRKWRVGFGGFVGWYSTLIGFGYVLPGKHWGKIKEWIFIPWYPHRVFLCPPLFTYPYTGQPERVLVFSGWTGRGGYVVLNREAHHCTLALDTVQEEVKAADPLLGRPWRRVTKKEGCSGDLSHCWRKLRNRGLKGHLKGPSPAQSRSNLGQTAHIWSN